MKILDRINCPSTTSVETNVSARATTLTEDNGMFRATDWLKPLCHLKVTRKYRGVSTTFEAVLLTPSVSNKRVSRQKSGKDSEPKNDPGTAEVSVESTETKVNGPSWTNHFGAMRAIVGSLLLIFRLVGLGS